VEYVFTRPFHPATEMSIKALQAAGPNKIPKIGGRTSRSLPRNTVRIPVLKRLRSKPLVFPIRCTGWIGRQTKEGLTSRPLSGAIPGLYPTERKLFANWGQDVASRICSILRENFTAAKLAWVKENEPGLFEQIDKILLPGDYIALRLSGEAVTTASGLSEGIFWDFKNNQPADFILNYWGIPREWIPGVLPSFSEQGRLLAAVAEELGLSKGPPICYRAGVQPNNALSLNVLNPGEIAATAGTSGVVYVLNDSLAYDPQSRVNSFAHVNHSAEATRIGVVLCINGTGILNAWHQTQLCLKQPELRSTE
jgi:sugar (pentulose or hexulose) kinase